MEMMKRIANCELWAFADRDEAHLIRVSIIRMSCLVQLQ